MRVDFMVSHYWGLWRQSCALCFFTSRAALRRPRRHPSARLPDKAASTRDVGVPMKLSLFIGAEHCRTGSMAQRPAEHTEQVRLARRLGFDGDDTCRVIVYRRLERM